MYTSSINLDEEIVLELTLKKKHVKPKTAGIPKKKKKKKDTEISKTNRVFTVRP